MYKRQLKNVPDIGAVTADFLIEWFSLPQSQHQIGLLREAGVSFESVDAVKDTRFAGMTFVLTGDCLLYTSVCNVTRNLTDAQFTALVKQGGGAGINLYPEFLGLGCDIDAVFAHIEHFISLGGEKSVFLGCDLDGIEQMPKGISGVQDLGRIYEALLRHNYPERLARDIFRNNILRVMEKVL